MKNYALAVILPLATFLAIEYVPAFRPMDRWMDRNEGWAMCLVIAACFPFGFMLARNLLAFHSKRKEV
jgi:hypothetical protein